MSAPLSGPAFPFRIENGRVAVHSGPAKFGDDLRHLLSTRLGERVVRRDYGGGVHGHLQDPNDTTLRTLIRHEIELALRAFLPQARLLGPIQLAAQGSELTVSFDYRIDPAADAAAGPQRVELTLGAP
ncbi:MAG: GPW/gp25 family protein [Micromonosporaceae bacterium]|nr:GPW/gp25 family protein [Micromonosporaceae bacterium]